jgi:hypothetical protein
MRDGGSWMQVGFVMKQMSDIQTCVHDILSPVGGGEERGEEANTRRMFAARNNSVSDFFAYRFRSGPSPRPSPRPNGARVTPHTRVERLQHFVNCSDHFQRLELLDP